MRGAMSIDNKKVAREWLIFMGCFIFGGLILPFLLALTIFPIRLGEQTILSFYSKFLKALFFEEGDNYIFAWFLITAPYLLVQLVRSVAWAVNTLKRS
jgi:hypothetical protein